MLCFFCYFFFVLFQFCFFYSFFLSIFVLWRWNELFLFFYISEISDRPESRTEWTSLASISCLKVAYSPHVGSRSQRTPLMRGRDCRCCFMSSEVVLTLKLNKWRLSMRSCDTHGGLLTPVRMSFYFGNIDVLLYLPCAGGGCSCSRLKWFLVASQVFVNRFC